MHISWWRHQMETFSALLAICVRNSPVTDEFPAQRPVTRSFDVFFDLRLNKGWVNNREADGLRRHHTHYDVTVMIKEPAMWKAPPWHDVFMFSKCCLIEADWRIYASTNWPALVQMMACAWPALKPLSKPMLGYCWTVSHKLQWNFNRKSFYFIREKAFENVIWKMAAILSRLLCVDFTLVVIWKCYTEENTD